MNHDCTTHGLVIYESQVLPLAIQITIADGVGEVLVAGPIDENFEENFKRAYSFVHDLGDLGEILLPDFSAHDILVSLKIPIPDVPILGDSYGLALGIGLACAASARIVRPSLAITGGLAEDTSVVPVGDIDKKRASARSLGFDLLVLPATQLDFFCTTIAQLPVTRAFDAWTSLTYDDIE